jgi:hypothetical protein
MSFDLAKVASTKAGMDNANIPHLSLQRNSRDLRRIKRSVDGAPNNSCFGVPFLKHIVNRTWLATALSARPFIQSDRAFVVESSRQFDDPTRADGVVIVVAWIRVPYGQTMA